MSEENDGGKSGDVKSPEHDPELVKDSTKPDAMTSSHDSTSSKQTHRERKLAAALRDNLRRRKAPDDTKQSKE